MTEKNYSLHLPGPKKSQYDASPGLTIRGDTPDEFVENVYSLLLSLTKRDDSDLTGNILSMFFVNVKEAIEGNAGTVRGSTAGTGESAAASSGAGSTGTPATGAGTRPCPQCGNGDLVKRSGKKGDFFGCTSFPNCRYTENA